MPCFVTARRMRSIPSAVFGPALRPPCSLQRPFIIAGHWQRVPRRVFAPQRGAFEKSPGAFPFLSHPRRLSWGVLSVFRVIPHRPRSCGCHSADDGLSALVYMDVLHGYLLLARFALELLHGLDLVQVQPHQTDRP